MSIRGTLKALFGAPPDIVWPPMPELPVRTHVRPVEPSDHARCVEIYRNNEPGRFPPGFEPTLRGSLIRTDYLWVAMCVDDRLVAFGGINRALAMQSDRAWLVFGMVDPAWHGRGLGSWMLLVRLCALPQPNKSVRVMMSNVSGAQAFFERFGFAHQGEIFVGRDGVRLDSTAATLREPTWRSGRAMVQAQGLDVGDLTVPEADLWRLPGDGTADVDGKL